MLARPAREQDQIGARRYVSRGGIGQQCAVQTREQVSEAVGNSILRWGQMSKLKYAMIE